MLMSTKVTVKKEEDAAGHFELLIISFLIIFLYLSSLRIYETSKNYNQIQFLTEREDYNNSSLIKRYVQRYIFKKRNLSDLIRTFNIYLLYFF